MSTAANKPAVTFEVDTQLVRQLLAELESEQAALVVSDIDTIEVLIDKRLLLLQELSVTAQKRYDALAANGFEPNEKGMSNWLKKQSNPMLAKAWGDFQQLLLQAKEMNRLNGILISKHFNRNQQLLSQIQGNSTQTDTYSKHGQTKSQFYKRNAFSA
jgi:flagellar biosynthesis protein FlgN